MPTSESPTRRTFLTSAAAVTATTLLPRTLLAQTESQLAADPERPQFHLLPAHNWMNDPNGPIYFNGRYHMFFQYNPLAATWGDMSWNHAVSPDMLHWTHLPVAMTPTPGSPDAYGCFSGSALQVGKRVYAVYTGTVKSTLDKATIHADGVQESQCLAWSDDPRLITWTKDPQPIIPLPPFPVTGFRDPSAWKQGGAYYMTVGSGETKIGGCVLLYRSHDLHSWDYLHKLTEAPWTPPPSGEPTSNPCDDGEMWECPDFFPLPGSSLASHCLIYSTRGKVYWQSGTLDHATMLFHPLKTGLLDLDAFYAPKTQLDAQGNRILWGWIPERRHEAAMRTAGWSGMMSLPRVLTLTPDGNLRQEFLPATARLRRPSNQLLEQLSARSSATIHEATGEFLCTGATQLILTAGTTNLLTVTYSPVTHTFTTDSHTIPLQPTDSPTLHAFIDGSVIELLIGNRIGFTKRFYYPEKIAPNILIRADAPFQAWPIKPISPNRLTTEPS
jgi:beta-fructofuranosidase